MQFVTKEKMLERVGEQELIALTDNEQPYTNLINDTKLNAAMDMANSEIEGYLSGRYKLPLAAVPPFLAAIGCDMAHFHGCQGNTQETDRTVKRYENAVKILTNISKGVMGIGGSPVGEAAPVKTDSNNVQWMVGRRDFGSKNW